MATIKSTANPESLAKTTVQKLRVTSLCRLSLHDDRGNRSKGKLT